MKRTLIALAMLVKALGGKVIVEFHEVQDVGEATRQFWGDSDYEWWAIVKAQQARVL